MGRKRRRLPPFEVEIEALGKGGAGVGTAPDGAPVRVRPAPPGGRVAVVPTGRKKGTWIARRTALVRPAAEGVQPPCRVFGVCGGCVLQELSLPAQRRAKHRAALADVASGLGLSTEALGEGVVVHPVRGDEGAYHYRNKVELSFGPRRFLAEADHRAGAPIEGRWLGFHAPGRFDRVADTDRCWLITEAANVLLGVLRREVLEGSDTPLWDARAHTGVWRHALLREGMATGEHLVGLTTTSKADPDEVARVARALRGAPLPDGHRVVGVVHRLNDGVADVAHGETCATWGRAALTERLGGIAFHLSPDAFFQTSTAGAEILYATVAEALGRRVGTLLDLYCGIGSIGLVLADRADRIIGVEEVEVAVQDARENARRAGVAATYHAARLEDALDVLEADLDDPVAIVDPPRAGLHPRVARRLARLPGDTLVYVACKPASLGRDAAILAEGGWRLEALWTVDLFPQTGHIEMVGRFVRD
jgi:23S rRNA (uracil1939-C5)-methyltransferase